MIYLDRRTKEEICSTYMKTWKVFSLRARREDQDMKLLYKPKQERGQLLLVGIPTQIMLISGMSLSQVKLKSHALHEVDVVNSQVANQAKDPHPDTKT